MASSHVDALEAELTRLTALIADGDASPWSLALDDVQAPLLAALVPAGPRERPEHRPGCQSSRYGLGPGTHAVPVSAW